MKLKFVLVPLMVLGLSVGSYAEETKWITPSNKVCVANGGKINNGVCDAKWLDAEDICRASGGRLPSRYELKKVVVDCGGIINEMKKNMNNSSYQSCYERKGFISYDSYWSSTTYASNTNEVWCVHFYRGSTYGHSKSHSSYVRCVRAGQ